MSPSFRLNAVRVVAALLVALALVAPTEAMASPTSDSDAAYAQGVAAFKAQNYDAARLAFARSYELLPRASALLSLALAELDAGHPVDAATHLRAYLHKPDASQEKVDEVRNKMLPRAEAQIGQIRIEAPVGSTIRVDDAAIGTAPLSETVEVMPGTHVVAAILPTGRSQSVSIHAIAGEVLQARIVGDEPPPTPPATAPFAPAVSPAPSADTAGSHWTTAKKITFIALASGAVVSIGLGVGFGLSSNHDADQAAIYGQGLSSDACTPSTGKTMPAQCTPLASAVNAQDTHTSLSRGFYAGGAVLAVGAIATFVFWPNAKSDTSRAWVRPMIGTTTGVQLGASF